MKRKYLDKAGATYRPDKIRPKHLRTRIRHWIQRRTYGFDDRETWDMDKTFYLWLYEHLMMFNDVTITDLEKSKLYTYREEEYTVAALIDILLASLQIAITKDYDLCTPAEREHIDDIPKIWAIIIREMWW
ncbi:MAG: hypothetical protein J6S14_15190 [Clostridia bacterium]|nr:hypothetical protein [Clostridia bacterium]